MENCVKSRPAVIENIVGYFKGSKSEWNPIDDNALYFGANIDETLLKYELDKPEEYLG